MWQHLQGKYLQKRRVSAIGSRLNNALLGGLKLLLHFLGENTFTILTCLSQQPKIIRIKQC